MTGSKTSAMFVTLEGGEGAGKSTSRDFIVSLLEEYNVPFIQTREPGGTQIGEALRELLLSKDGTAPSVKLSNLRYGMASGSCVIVSPMQPTRIKGTVAALTWGKLKRLRRWFNAEDIPISPCYLILIRSWGWRVLDSVPSSIVSKKRSWRFSRGSEKVI